jgi:hypothetical protein
MRVVVYVLCYDDHSEARARDEYGVLPWARVLRLPTTTEHNKYMEGQVFLGLLESLKHEWEDADFVGTISWKASDKIDVPDMQELCQRAMDGQAISLFFLPEVTVGYSVMAHPRFLQVWVPLLTQMGYAVDDAVSPEFPLLAGNYWLTKPALMSQFCEFYKRAVQVLETHQPLQHALWSDSCYATHLTSDQCMEIYGRPYITHHPFVCERLAGFFFWKHQVKVLKLLDSSYKFWVHLYGPERAQELINAIG